MRKIVAIASLLALAAVLAALAGCGGYMQGNMALRSGDPEEAIRQYRQTLAANPNYSLARNRLGLALIWADRPTEARTELETVLARDPDDWTAHYYLAGAKACQGDAAGAQASLDPMREVFVYLMIREMQRNAASLFATRPSCLQTAQGLWDIQQTAAENQRQREIREQRGK